LFRKLTNATCSDPKEAGIEKHIAMASDYTAQRPMQCSTGIKQKAKASDNKQ
jgi:hypothetical protein